jgi:hypothetical protein
MKYAKDVAQFSGPKQNYLNINLSQNIEDPEIAGSRSSLAPGRFFSERYRGLKRQCINVLAGKGPGFLDIC